VKNQALKKGILKKVNSWVIVFVFRTELLAFIMVQRRASRFTTIPFIRKSRWNWFCPRVVCQRVMSAS